MGGDAHIHPSPIIMPGVDFRFVFVFSLLALLYSIEYFNQIKVPVILTSHPSRQFGKEVLPKHALNASVLLEAAEFQEPFAQGSSFDPFLSYAHALGFKWFSKEEVLECIHNVGGLAFVGDSMLREASTVLLEYLGRPRIKVQGVAWENQRADEAFEILLPDGTTRSAHLFFRFAKNVHPELTSRIREVTESLGVRAVVAHSQFWDFNTDTGATWRDWLSRYIHTVSLCLEEVREVLAPQLAALDAALESKLTPRRWLWRTGNPTVLSRLDEKRRTFLTPGIIHASNLFVKEALHASSISGGLAPVWEIVDTWDIIPYGMEHLIREDGYHPTDKSALNFVMVALNKLCGSEVAASTLSQLADS